MTYSKVAIGQQALVIDNTSGHSFKTGEIVCRVENEVLEDSGVKCKNERTSSWVRGVDLLAVGDKVTRGPDMHSHNAPHEDPGDDVSDDGGVSVDDRLRANRAPLARQWRSAADR